MPKVKNHRPLKKVTATAATALLALAVLSFGVFTVFSVSGFALGLVLGFTADNVSATSGNSANSTINVNVSDGITIRILDSTATTDLEELAFDFVPTDAGVSTTKNAVVEVATSNETGYKLYVQSDWREDNTSSSGAYADSKSTAAHTTSLIHFGATSIPAVTDKIPTNLGTSYPYWYYYNDYYSENKVIPAFGNPDKLAESENPTDGDYTTVPITVGVDTSIVAGTYRNKLVFTAIANELPVDYKLVFDSNGGSGIEATQEAYKVQTSYTFTIPKNKVIAEDGSGSGSDSGSSSYTVEYGTKALLGWSENKDATVPDYVTGDSITLIADNPKLSDKQTVEKTLYAVWRDAPEFYNITNMQDMTTAICSALYTPSNATGDDVTLISDPRDYTMLGDNTANVAQSTLSDIRDTNSYTVRKLADGNCWMTENLQYALTTGAAAIGSYNDGSTFSFAPTGCSTDAGCAMNGNTQLYGGRWYYTWYAATAGKGLSSSVNTDINGSVCPAHWKLPYNYSYSKDKSYGKLMGAYGMSTDNDPVDHRDLLELIPLSFRRFGHLINGKQGYSGSGTGWMSTATSRAALAYWWIYDSVSTDPQYQYGKNYGLSVRCVAL